MGGIGRWIEVWPKTGYEEEYTKHVSGFDGTRGVKHFSIELQTALKDHPCQHVYTSTGRLACSGDPYPSDG